MNPTRILLIEDEPDMANSIAYCLRKEKYRVTIATDGRTGLEEALRDIPDLIILDLMLPNLPGEEICKQIREHQSEEIKKIPILILSGKGSEKERIIGSVIGGSAYLTKPFEMEDLLDGVKWFLERKNKRQAAAKERS